VPFTPRFISCFCITLHGAYCIKDTSTNIHTAFEERKVLYGALAYAMSPYLSPPIGSMRPLFFFEQSVSAPHLRIASDFPCNQINLRGWSGVVGVGQSSFWMRLPTLNFPMVGDRRYNSWLTWHGQCEGFVECSGILGTIHHTLTHVHGWVVLMYYTEH
jgi:hypothetical protein